MARLAAQIPPPRAHETRYHGILAPAANRRDKIVPRTADAERRGASRVPAEQRTGWATLLQKVFAVDVLTCPSCGGRIRPVAIITRPCEIEATLERFDREQQRPP